MGTERSGNPRRWWEWFGCFAVWAWAYCLVNSFEPVVIGNGAVMAVLVMLLVASVAATVLGCGSDPRKLSRAAAVFTPVGVVATAVMFLMPAPAYLLLYGVSFLAVGPPLVRRLYGLAQVFEIRSNARMILPVVPAVFVFHAAWVAVPASFEAKFVILAVLGLASLWRVGSVSLWRVSDPNHRPSESRERSSGRIVLLVGYFGIFAVADIAYQVLITALATEADAQYPIPWLAATIVSGLVLSFGGFVTGSDAGRGWLVIGLAVTIVGLVAPLLGGLPDLTYVELLTCSIGAGTALLVLLVFLPTVDASQRLESLFASVGTIWIAVRGSLVILLQSQFSFMQHGGGKPPSWLLLGTLFVTISLLVISFVVLNRAASADLIAAVMALVSAPPKRRRSAESVVREMDRVDRRMVALLADGQSLTEIADKLSVPVAQINDRITSIRRSLADPESGRRAEVLARLAGEHGLTAREVEMVEDICDKKPNAQIASERFITERTVKFHIGNVLAKLKVTNRREVSELVERATAEHADNARRERERD